MSHRGKWLSPVNRRLVLLGCAVGFICLIGPSAASSATSPCPGVPFEAPPAGATPAPPVQCGPGLIGIGNIGQPLSSVTGALNGPRPVGAFPTPAVAPPKLRSVASVASSASSTTCANDYGYGYLWETVSTGSPASVGNEQTAVSGVSVTSPGSNEHNAMALVSWQANHDSQSYWVQMGYVRGNMPGWTDNLSSGQIAIYLEFNTSGGVYQFSALAAVNQGERHNFDMTEDPSGHYYNFYLDGTLKWADVYQDYPMTFLLYGNEDYNLDGACEPGYADNNLFTFPMPNVHVDPGHALATAGSVGPWQSDGDTTESSLPGMGYTCGSNSNGYYWWCG